MSDVRKSLPEELREPAADHELLWNVPRKAIEEELMEYRDSGISLMGRHNGLVIYGKEDGERSAIIRMGPEMAVSAGLRALADHLEEK